MSLWRGQPVGPDAGGEHRAGRAAAPARRARGRARRRVPSSSSSTAKASATGNSASPTNETAWPASSSRSGGSGARAARRRGGRRASAGRLRPPERPANAACPTASWHYLCMTHAHEVNALGALALEVSAPRAGGGSGREPAWRLGSRRPRRAPRPHRRAVDRRAPPRRRADPFGTVRLVDRLAAAGLVERRVGATAARSPSSLTPEGRRAARRVLARREAAIESGARPADASRAGRSLRPPRATPRSAHRSQTEPGLPAVRRRGLRPRLPHKS